MIIALPRSGTTWAANWLTTDQLYCAHDPLATVHYSEWDTDDKLFPREGGMKLGISCTTIWNWPEWVNAHPARKVILHRDFADIQKSLTKIGIQQMQPGTDKALDALKGKHYQHKDLFDPVKAEEIWTFLTGLPFNRARHRALVEMSVQQRFAEIPVDAALVRRLVDEIVAKSTAPQGPQQASA